MNKSIFVSLSISFLLSSCGYSDRPFDQRVFMNVCTFGGSGNLLNSDLERSCNCGSYWMYERGKTQDEAWEICEGN